MLKASNGGGGRGMRIVNRKEDLAKEFEEAKNESRKLLAMTKYLSKNI
jgi:pyruvate carboxylase